MAGFLKDLRGILSCFCFASNNSGIFACGSYNNTVGIYEEDSLQFLIQDPRTGQGITQVTFSHDDRFLFCGGRKSEFIIGWDLRNMSYPIYRLPRQSPTHQRLQFNLSSCGKYLFTGDVFGKILVYDLTNGEGNLAYVLERHQDSVGGLALHPNQHLLATGSGQRHFHADEEDDEDIMNPNHKPHPYEPSDPSLLIWKLNDQTIS